MNQLTQELAELSVRKQKEIETHSSYELILLFWKIGCRLNQYSGGETVQDQKLLPAQVAFALVSRYGPFFTEQNILSMWRLARLLADDAGAQKLAAYVDWQNMVALMNVDGHEQLFFRMQQQVQMNVSPAVNEQKVLALLAEAGVEAMDTKPGNSLYRGNGSVMFKTLFSNTSAARKSIPKQDNEAYRLLNDLNMLITAFRNKHSVYLNSRFNLFLHASGRIIAEHLHHYTTAAAKEKLLKNLSLELEKTWGDLFSEANLYSIISYYRRFQYTDIACKVAYLLTWQQLAVLLQYEEIDNLHLYARLLAKGQTDFFAIAQIAQTGSVPEYVQTEQRILHQQLADHPPVPDKVTKTKTRNSVVTITELFVSLDYDIVDESFYIDIHSLDLFFDFMQTVAYV